MSQALNAAYQLSQGVELAPSSGGAIKVSMTVGLRGSFECGSCSDSMKLERGYCPFVEAPERATQPAFLSETGNPSVDELWACPKGVLLRNPGLAPTLQSFWGIQAAGVSGWFGEGLQQLPPRVAAAFQELHQVEQKFIASIHKMRSLMDRRP
jgi:hypothetical protein